MDCKEINVSFATDKYECMLVSMLSMIRNSSASSSYNIFVLAADNLAGEQEARIRDVISHYSNVNLKFFYVEKEMPDVEMSIPWITMPTYYRLLIPRLLADYDKCLYLDTDIIVKGDIRELYDVDIEGNMVAAVKAPSYHVRSKEAIAEHCDILQINSIDQYINAGVLLMNLKMMREEEFTDKGLKLIRERYPSQDQDIVNKLCYGKILHIPLRFNLMTKYFGKDAEALSSCFSSKEIYNALDAPLIIHYADRKKPWRDLSTPYSIDWWDECVKSNMRKEMHTFNMCMIIRNSLKPEALDQIKRVYIYGAGLVGRRVCEYLITNGYGSKICSFCSTTGNSENVYGFLVKKVDDLIIRNGDMVLLAAKGNLRSEMKNKCTSLGIEEVIEIDAYDDI